MSKPMNTIPESWVNLAAIAAKGISDSSVLSSRTRIIDKILVRMGYIVLDGDTQDDLTYPKKQIENIISYLSDSTPNNLSLDIAREKYIADKNHHRQHTFKNNICWERHSVIAMRYIKYNIKHSNSIDEIICIASLEWLADLYDFTVIELARIGKVKK